MIDILTLDDVRKKLAVILTSDSDEIQQLQRLERFFEEYRLFLPAFPSAHRVRKEKFRPKRYWTERNAYDSKAVHVGDTRYINPERHLAPDTEQVNPLKCIGDVWLFENDRLEGRPLPDRLARLAMGERENIPAVYCWKIGKFYYCTDGCHRIYMAYLMGYEVRLRCAAFFSKATLIVPWD